MIKYNKLKSEKYNFDKEKWNAESVERNEAKFVVSTEKLTEWEIEWIKPIKRKWAWEKMSVKVRTSVCKYPS